MGCREHRVRRSELLGLKWSDIDLDKATLSINRGLVAIGYELTESRGKTANSRRSIDLDPTTVDVLAGWQSWQGIERRADLDLDTVEALRLHRKAQQVERDEWGAGYIDNDLVFCKENGEPLHPQTYSQAFERIVAKSGLPRIRLHDLRHTHATIALRAGIPTKVISERLGHENPAFTLKQYAHVIPGMQADAAREIAALINDA